MSETLKRGITGLGFIIVMLGAPLLGKWVFLSLLTIVNILALNEYTRIFAAKKYAPFMGFTALIGTLCFFDISLVSYSILPGRFIILLLPLLLSFYIVELYTTRKSPFARAGISMAGCAYISMALGIFPTIAFVDGIYDPYKIIGCLLLIWSNDTFAYLVGRMIGKTPLFPSISPKKTWEGSLGGGICTIIVGFILNYFIPSFSKMEWMGLAFIFVLFSSWGDLVESRLKRSFNIKDSGNLLPGHGGILDRFDAQLFSVPFAAAFIWLIH